MHVARSFLYSGLACLALAACGDDPAVRTDYLDPTPVTFNADNRGLTIQNGASLTSLSAKLAEDVTSAPAAVIVEQIYSERVHVAEGGTPRDPVPRFDNSISTLEDNTAVMNALADVQRTYWVVDLQRLDREWLVDWNGVGRDAEDTRNPAMTFSYRATEEDGDYQEALVDRIVGAFEDAAVRPQSVVIGMEMERHYLAVPEDWPAFIASVRQIRTALREVDPAVRVAVGFNWANFMDAAVPAFVGPAGQDSVNFQAVQLAWDTIIAPVYFDGADGAAPARVLDFYAFTAIPDAERYATPDDLDPSHFSAIPTYFAENPAHELPVAWTGIGWPIFQGSSSFVGEYLELFLSAAGGVNTELVTWWGYSHLQSNDCRAYTQSIGTSNAICFRGMYQSSSAPVSGLRDLFMGEN